jgi:hypothetical protein
MKTPLGYVEDGFRPSIERFSISDDKLFLQSWRFPTIASPAPLGHRESKAAVWIGRRENQYGESPLIAAALPVDKHLGFQEHHWFVGIDRFSWDQGEFGRASTELHLAKIAIDSAIHGPYSNPQAMYLIKELVSA